jgi:predicted nuclease with TOPRIM domain
VKNFLAEKKEAEVAAKQGEYDELKEKLKKIPKELSRLFVI